MGKRSDFDRRERDFYPTPVEAVLPLLPHLPVEFQFFEPCAGDGQLIYHIMDRMPGAECICASDVAPQGQGIYKSDFREVETTDLDSLIITNPPWNRKILHPLIEHFAPQNPTWLLFDADWIHTKQSAPYMPMLKKIVSVGRVKWIPDSKMTGKDNCAWHLFGATPSQGIEFVGRAA